MSLFKKTAFYNLFQVQNVFYFSFVNNVFLFFLKKIHSMFYESKHFICFFLPDTGAGIWIQRLALTWPESYG